MRVSNLIKFLFVFLLLIGNPLWAVKEKIEKLEEDVALIRATYNKKPIETINTLKTLSKAFDVLEDEEQKWKSFISERKISQWKSQTAKQAVGAWLFYPPHVDELLDSSYTAYLLDRNDMIWSFALAAKYEDPRGQHYLAYLLARIRRDHDHTLQAPDFLENLYKKAQKTFSAATAENDATLPQALYVLAYEHAFGSCSVGFSDQNLSKARDYFRKITTSNEEMNGERKRSEFQLLRMKTEYAGGNRGNPPSAKDYAEVKFGPAFVQAAILSKDQKEQKRLLEEASGEAINYSPAYISLGLWYHHKTTKDDASAEQCFLSATKNGISDGYVKAGILKVGNASAKALQKFYPNLRAQQIAEEEGVKKALQYFEAAGKEGNPQGWNYFVSVYESLYHIDKNLETDVSNGNNNDRENWLKELTLKIKGGIEKGLGLGDSDAYRRLQYYTPRLFTREDYGNLIEQYGNSPYENLWEDVRGFIEEENN